MYFNLDRLRGNAFVRAVAVLAGGTAFGQAVALAVLPILTRLYTPSDFQVFAVYAALVQVASVAATLRYELAIPLPERDEDAASLLVLALACGGIFIAGATVACMFPSRTFGLIGQPSLRPYAAFVPVGITAVSAYGTLQFWVLRKRRFSLLARTRISQSVGGAIAQLALGLWRAEPMGLIVGYIVQSGSGIAALVLNVLRHDRESLRTTRPTAIWAQARRYRDFPRYDVVGALAQMANLQLPLLAIARLPIGPEAGYLSLAMRIGQAPIGLVAAAVAQVFAAAAPQAHRDGSLGRLTLKTTSGLIRVAAGPILAFAMIAPQACSLIFGQTWARSGELMRWLAPTVVAQMLGSSIGTTLYVKGRQRTALLLQCVGFVLRVGGVYGAALISYYVSEVYAISGFVFYMIYFAVALAHARPLPKENQREILRSAVYACAWVAGGIMVRAAIYLIYSI